jgi:hypothetical protein
MSLLCDVFSASEEDPLTYPGFAIGDHDKIAPPRFELISFSGLTPDTFENLAKSLMASTTGKALRHIAHEEAGEWWLEQFSSEFVVTVLKIEDA